MKNFTKKHEEQINKVKNEINTIERIKFYVNDLRNSEQKVANYIAQHPFKIIETTISELAKMSNSSEATIVRACKNMSFHGFQDLKFSLRQDIKEALSKVYEEVKPDDSSISILKKIFKANAEAINNTVNTINYESFNIAFESLKNANKIAIFGQGGAASIAFDAYHNLLNLGKNCFYNADPNMQVIFAKFLKKKDVCLAISRTGEMREVIQSVELAKEGGAFCIGVTASPRSALARISDVTLYTNSGKNIFSNIDTAERCAELTIIDALYVCLANSDIEKAKKCLMLSTEATSLNRITRNIILKKEKRN